MRAKLAAGASNYCSEHVYKYAFPKLNENLARQILIIGINALIIETMDEREPLIINRLSSMFKAHFFPQFQILIKSTT